MESHPPYSQDESKENQTHIVFDSDEEEASIAPPQSSLEIGYKEKEHFVVHSEEQAVETEVGCCKVSAERQALLWRENPMVYALSSGGGLYLLLEQFSKLWPEERAKLHPVFSAISVLGFAGGLSIGALSLSYTKAADVYKHVGWNEEVAALRFARIKRFWLASLEGFGAIAPFILGESIAVYCADAQHWDEQDQCRVSNGYFATHFLPTPLILGSAYVLWNFILPSKKEYWASQNCLKNAAVHVVELGFQALKNSRYIQALFQAVALFSVKAALVNNISKNINPLYYEIPAILGASLTLGVQCFKPQYRQKLITFFMYLYAVVTLFNMSNDTVKGYTAEGDARLLSASIINTAAISASLIGGAALMAKLGGTVVREIKIISEYISVGYPSLLKNQWNDELLETNHERLTKEAQRLAEPLANQILESRSNDIRKEIMKEVIKKVREEENALKYRLAELEAENQRLREGRDLDAVSLEEIELNASPDAEASSSPYSPLPGGALLYAFERRSTTALPASSLGQKLRSERKAQGR